MARFSLGEIIQDVGQRFAMAADTFRRGTSHARPGGFFSFGLGPATDVFVDSAAALSLSTVWACVMNIASDVASSEWQVYEQTPDGQRHYRYDDAYDLLNYQPNPEQTAFDLRLTLLANALLGQYSVAEITRTVGGRAGALWPIATDRVRRDRLVSGGLVYRVQNFGREESILPAHDVFVIRPLSLDGETALPIIEAAKSVIARAISTRDFSTTFFSNGLSPSAVFTPKEGTTITKEAAEAYVKQIREYMTGARRGHGIMVLPHQLELKQIGTDPDKAQFLQTEQHLVEEICRYYRMPPHKVQKLDRATNNNIEHQGIEYKRDACNPWAVRQSQEASMKITTGSRRLRTAIDLDWLCEGDAKSIAEADSILVNAGLRNRDEVRRQRGVNPIPGGAGQMFTVQMGMGDLDAAKGRSPEGSQNSEDEDDEEEAPAAPAARPAAARPRPLRAAAG